MDQSTTAENIIGNDGVDGVEVDEVDQDSQGRMILLYKPTR